MSLPDELKPIFDRIAQHQQTDADMEVLRQQLSAGGQLVSQQGKFAVNIGQGQDIHIGDRIYQGADAETIRDIVQATLKELQAKPNEEISTGGNAVEGVAGCVTNATIVTGEVQEELEQLKRDLLVRRWVQANLRTRSIMLKAVDREKERWLTEQQIHEFPGPMLEIVDNLWRHASGGKFGFRQQLHILELHNQAPQAFGESVGWLVEGAWIKQDSQLSIDLETTPAGHLPWNVLPMITMDNALLNGFVIGLRKVNKQLVKKEWQRQLIADFMGSAGWLIRDRVDKEEFKRSLEYELSQNEPWWEGDRMEELKVKRLFALLLSHHEFLKN
jgi:Effector-associated domain 10/GUN4-like